MKPKTRALIFLAVGALSLSSFAGRAAPQVSSLDAVLDALFAVRDFKEVAISPDGLLVAWVEQLHGPGGMPSPNSAIYIQDLSTPENAPRRISAGPGTEDYAEGGVAWSPDGRQLAFLSDRGDPGQLQLYVADVASGSTRKLTDLKGYLQSPSWSPDGTQLALLFTENAPRVAGPLEPMTPPSGVIEQHIYEQRLAILDPASGQVRQLSPADLYVYEYNWSPDGRRFVATAAHGAGDANWYIAELYTIDATTGATRSIYAPPVQQQIAVPRWSPDGRQVAFIGGLMSDEGNTGGDIFVMPTSPDPTGRVEPRNVTPNIKCSPSWLTWVAPDRILFSEWIDGESGLSIVAPRQGEITPLWRSPESNSTGGWSFGVSLARDGKNSAMVLQSFEHPPEVWAGPLGAWKQVTHLNRTAEVNWGKAQSLHWTNQGLPMQGWLIYPREYDPSRRYPLVVSVHGGPGSMVRPSFPGTFFNFVLLSHEGYFVLFPNPRGSFGQGEAFTQANVKDFGYGDLRDILAGVGEAVKSLPVDPNRVGIGGWSYGGFMTMWAVTQTQRFHAAVAGAGIANWQSYYGENDIDLWLIPFFGASVYDDPAVYAKSSPITFIKNIKTPTLILVGDRDGECPVPQSFEFWHALKTLGVPNEFAVYPGEGHLIANPQHRRDILQRTINWFNQYLR